MNKKKAEQIHASRRFLQRAQVMFSQRMNDYFCKLIQKKIQDTPSPGSKIEFVSRQSHRVTLWDITFQEKLYRVVYDKLRKQIVTVLWAKEASPEPAKQSVEQRLKTLEKKMVRAETKAVAMAAQIKEEWETWRNTSMIDPKNVIVSFVEGSPITCRLIHVPTGLTAAGEGSNKDQLKTRLLNNLVNQITACNLKAEPVSVRHSDLERFSDSSIYKSICPKCKEGLLLVNRDQKTLELMAHDRCVLCGQQYIYSDIEELKKK